jgi:iron(III) transport system permease protein
VIKQRSYFWTTITLLAAVLIVFFLIYPFFTLLISSFRNPADNSWSLVNFKTFFTRAYYYQGLVNSLILAALTTFFAILIGLPLAYFMQAFVIKGRKLINLLIIISMLSPPFIGAYAWILMFGSNGFITNFFGGIGIKLPTIYGFWGLLIIFTLKLYPFIYLYASGALKKIDFSLLEAATSLGCSSLKRLFQIILPLLLPTLLAGGLLVFTNTLADFGTPMLIGQGYNVIPVQIYSEFVGELGGNASFASAIATILVIITLILFIVQNSVLNKRSFQMNGLKPMPARALHGWRSVFVHAFTYIILFFSILPQIVVIYTSFLNVRGGSFTGSFSLVSYQRVFSRMFSSISNSFELSIISTLIIIFLSIFIAYIAVRRKTLLSRLIDMATMLPYVIPGSVVGIALLMSFNERPLLLSGTVAIMVISFILRTMPYTLRSSSAILHQINPSIEEAAVSLGASAMRTFFTVTFIVMLPGVLSGAILSYINILNELSSSIILYTSRTRTLSVAIYSEVNQGSYGTAAALSTILTATTALSLMIFNKFSRNRELLL